MDLTLQQALQQEEPIKYPHRAQADAERKRVSAAKEMLRDNPAPPHTQQRATKRKNPGIELFVDTIEHELVGRQRFQHTVRKWASGRTRRIDTKEMAPLPLPPPVPLPLQPAASATLAMAVAQGQESTPAIATTTPGQNPVQPFARRRSSSAASSRLALAIATAQTTQRSHHSAVARGPRVTGPTVAAFPRAARKLDRRPATANRAINANARTPVHSSARPNGTEARQNATIRVTQAHAPRVAAAAR